MRFIFRSTLISALLIGALVGITPSLAAAQEPPRAPGPRKLVISDAAIAAGLASAPLATQQANLDRDNDSVNNGAVIGAIVGGLAAGVFAGVLCSALREPNNPPCWGDVLRIGAIGAGVGLAAGVGIDALAAAHPSQSVAGVHPTRRRR